MKVFLNKAWSVVWPWLQSSKDPQKLSLTLKSVAGFAVALGLLTQGDSDTLTGAIVELVGAVSILLSSVGILWGLIRKFKK